MSETFEAVGRGLDPRGHAVVLGASVAGLLAARVLSTHFSRVTLLERDDPPAEPAPRRGVPQGQHAHLVLARGKQVLEEFFPGFERELAAAGASFADQGDEIYFYHFGGYKARTASGVIATGCSRALLETLLRRRVLALPGVVLETRREVLGIELDGTPTRVKGVRVRSLAGDCTTETLAAEVVVDAMGRGSALPRWLAGAGLGEVAESTIEIGVGYTSRLYRRSPRHLGERKALYCLPKAPTERRTAALFPIEGDRWQVTLGGWLGDHPPSSEGGYLDFARSIPAREVAAVLSAAEPLSELSVYNFPSNQRRHYDRFARWPLGLFALGDAVCSFNPILGQGMTSGALQAAALAGAFAETDDPARRWQLYRHRSRRVLDDLWLLSAGEDFRYPETRGPKPAGLDWLNAYTARVHRACLVDPVLNRAFLRVMNVLDRPARLLAPRLVLRALRASHYVERLDAAPAALPLGWTTPRA